MVPNLGGAVGKDMEAGVGVKEVVVVVVVEADEEVEVLL